MIAWKKSLDLLLFILIWIFQSFHLEVAFKTGSTYNLTIPEKIKSIEFSQSKENVKFRHFALSFNVEKRIPRSKILQTIFQTRFVNTMWKTTPRILMTSSEAIGAVEWIVKLKVLPVFYETSKWKIGIFSSKHIIIGQNPFIWRSDLHNNPGLLTNLMARLSDSHFQRPPKIQLSNLSS